MKHPSFLIEESFRPEAQSAWVEEAFRSPTLSLTHQGFHPFTTIQPRKGKQWDGSSLPVRQTLKQSSKSPYTRIRRVQQIIQAQKLQADDINETSSQKIAGNLLKPQFKIRGTRSTSKKWQSSVGNESEVERERLHVHVVTIDKPNEERRAATSFEMMSSLGNTQNSNSNNFQDNFKNRSRLQRRLSRPKQQASLLERLNRISEQYPIQRYKSRAFHSAYKVTPFFSIL